MGKKGVLGLRRNPREVKADLAPIIGKRAAEKIEADLQKQARALFRLGRNHLAFAKSVDRKNWRQIISRTYYGAYNMSRAVRLMVKGDYAEDVKDHQRFDQIPGDFPSQATYANRFDLLRADRNLADYDHQAQESDLSISPDDAIMLAEEFSKDAVNYVKGKSFLF